jgi:phage gpG-like protein
MDLKIKGLGDGNFFNLDWWEDSQPKVARMLEQEHKDVWSREQNPWDGTKWKELAPKYKEQKLKKHGPQPILRATGKMQDTMKIRPTNNGLFDVKTTSYGADHQFGTDRLAERTWVGIPDQAIPKIEDIVLKNISKKH